MLQHQQQVPTSQPQQRTTQESVENEVGNGGYEKPQPRERKSSLAAVQKTLDSILEESEHDSSTKRSTIESENECSDYSEAEEDSKSEYESELEESEGDENFDSEEEIVSDLEELLDSEEILRTFQVDTDELIKKEQESILNEFIQNNSDLSQLTQNLERLHSDISNLGKSSKELIIDSNFPPIFRIFKKSSKFFILQFHQKKSALSVNV